MSWVPGTTYVIGHQRPDSDALGSAMGYAWFLQAIGRTDVQAARCGAPGPESSFALDRFGAQAPQLLTAVWPTFAHVAAPEAPLHEEAPLDEVLRRMSAGARALPLVDAQGRARGAITPASLARAFLAARDPLSLKPSECAEKVPCFSAGDRISDMRSAFLKCDADDFLILGELNGVLGMAPRHVLLDPPRARLILVDHNEVAQAVPGAEEAEIVEVLDHHKLGNPFTTLPIRFVVEPVGCTCTLVAEMCRARALQPPTDVAGMLLTGLLSDTLVFRSPTCTPRDEEAAAWLADSLGIDATAYGRELLGHEPGLSAPVDEIVDGDRKAFRIGGAALSVAQVEVTSLGDLSSRREALLAAMDARREREGLALLALMVTDVVEGRSHLLLRGEKRIVSALPFPRIGPDELDLGNVVSRKKQLIPALYAALE